jgi:hypothetical protein
LQALFPDFSVFHGGPHSVAAVGARHAVPFDGTSPVSKGILFAPFSLFSPFILLLLATFPSPSSSKPLFPVTPISLARLNLQEYNAYRIVNGSLGDQMKSRRIKILVLFLAAAAIAGAICLRPERFQVDNTQYEFVSLSKPEYESSDALASTRLGVVIGHVVYSYKKVDITKWYPDGRQEKVSFPENPILRPISMNDEGAIVGDYLNQQGNSVDSFVWNPTSGLHLLKVCETFHFDKSSALSINNKGQIAGSMMNNNPFKMAVFLYDPVEGLFDIGSLGAFPVRLGGMNDEGVIVGSSCINSNFTHAFVWTMKDGMKDIHSVATQAVSSRAEGISSDGWIFIQAYDKNDNGRILLFHPPTGKTCSVPFDDIILSAKPVGNTNRFVFSSQRRSRRIWKFSLRDAEVENWIWEFDKTPVLIVPKMLSGKSWGILGMTDQGLICGRYLMGINDYTSGMDCDGFFLRPIRTEESRKK